MDLLCFVQFGHRSYDLLVLLYAHVLVPVWASWAKLLTFLIFLRHLVEAMLGALWHKHLRCINMKQNNTSICHKPCFDDTLSTIMRVLSSKHSSNSIHSTPFWVPALCLCVFCAPALLTRLSKTQVDRASQVVQVTGWSSKPDVWGGVGEASYNL